MLPISTKGMLGGMIGPMVAAAAVTAAANAAGNPTRAMAGMSTDPVAAASATAEPDMPAMIMLTTMFTCASPPVIHPTRAVANRTIRAVMPPADINSPASMKSGTASSGNESTP